MKKVFAIFIGLSLSACSNGGGGGIATNPSNGGGNGIGNPVYGCVDTSAINFNPLATQDDSSCHYLEGSSPIAYAGFKLSNGAEITNRATSDLLSSHKGIHNVFAIDTDVSKIGENDVDALVYQPSCIDGNDFTTRNFNLVLVGSTGSNSTNSTTATLQLELFGNTAKTTATTVAGIASPFGFSWSEPAMTNTAWSCTNGKFSIAGVGVAYTNANVAVVKMNNNDVYFGISRSLGINSNSVSSSNPISTVTYHEAGGNKWEAYGTYSSSIGEIFTPSTDAGLPNNFRITANSCSGVYGSSGAGLSLLSIASDSGVFSSIGPVCLKIPNDTGTAPISGKQVLSHGNSIYQGTMGIVSGKKIGVFSGDHASSLGSDSYSFLIEE